MRCDNEVAFLRVRGRTDLDVAGLTVEEIHDDSPGLGKMLVRLSLNHEADRPFPPLAGGLVGGGFVDLVLESVSPLRRKSFDRHDLLLVRNPDPLSRRLLRPYAVAHRDHSWAQDATVDSHARLAGLGEEPKQRRRR